MAYTAQTWVLGLAGGTPLNAIRLNHMEQGIADAHALIADLALNDHTHTSADITDANSANVVSTIVKRDATGFIAVSGITGLSTATGATQAVPKQQLDDAIATVSSASHTHPSTDISDSTATGRSLVTALDAGTARTVLDVPSTAEVTTEIGASIATERTSIDADIAAAQTAAQTYSDTSTDRVMVAMVYTAGAWPTRPDTSANNRLPVWVGAAATPVPTTGTETGGTAAAAPGDLIFYQ